MPAPPSYRFDKERSKALLSEKLRGFTLRTGWRPTDLAGRAGVLKSTFFTWYGGQAYPNPDKFEDLAKALETTRDQLLTEIGDLRFVTGPVDVPPPAVEEADALLSMQHMTERPGFMKIEFKAELPAPIARRIAQLAFQ